MAILSHSGSRGPGATIANHYCKIARDLHKGLPKQLHHLGWLTMDSDAGREYWQAMQLMGDFAAANHEIIHRKLTRALKAQVLFQMENHHHFAWSNMKKELEAAGVTLLSAGIDEAPGAYKDIHKVMREQADLVEVVARFDPRIVKMAHGKE